MSNTSIKGDRNLLIYVAWQLGLPTGREFGGKFEQIKNIIVR